MVSMDNCCHMIWIFFGPSPLILNISNSPGGVMAFNSSSSFIILVVMNSIILPATLLPTPSIFAKSSSDFSASNSANFPSLKEALLMDFILNEFPSCSSINCPNNFKAETISLLLFILINLEV